MLPKPLLKESYSFPQADEEVHTISQGHDTLYEWKCYADRPCSPMPDKRYKILSAETVSGYTLMKLEGLDSLPLTSEPYGPDHFALALLHHIDDNQLGFRFLHTHIRREQMDTMQMTVAQRKDAFLYTYYKASYLKTLTSGKKILTPNDAREVAEEMKNERNRLLVERYAQSHPIDPYHTGLSAELLNRACIQKGYDPVGAGPAIDRLLKKPS